MSKPVLYHADLSPPSRFACVTAQHIGLDVEIRRVDLMKREHQSSEYTSLNPAATVPVLVDGDLSVFDSSAISIYLVEKYAKDDSVYPKDLILRARVNERLFYVASYIFPRLYQIFVPAVYGREQEIPQSKIDEILRGYETIETFLKGNEYLSGINLTLPDLYLWCCMEFLVQLIPVDAEKTPNIVRWLSKMREHPSYEFNKTGAEAHVEFYRHFIEKSATNGEEN